MRKSFFRKLKSQNMSGNRYIRFCKFHESLIECIERRTKEEIEKQELEKRLVPVYSNNIGRVWSF
uniref:Uncharacterized protein n=1 Tax=viral metagenome TaxID=1070528 RepID=A0A6M3XYN9_9ZZZZ